MRASAPGGRIEAKILSYTHRSVLRNIAYLKQYLAGQARQDVLDIGCGSGLVPLLLPVPYAGIDMMLPQLRAAKQNLPQVRVARADAQRLPFRTAGFSHFTCTSVLEHLPEPAAALREIHRVVREGGVIKVPCRDRIPFLLDPVNSLRLRRGRPPVRFGVFDFGNISFLTTAAWRREITAAGFTITDEFDEDYTVLMQLLGLAMFVVFHRRNYEELPVARLVGLRLARAVFALHRLVRLVDFRTANRLQRIFIVRRAA